MYLDFYGFTEKPLPSPPTRFIFSKIHKEALPCLYGINNHFGFIELIGEVGTAKPRSCALSRSIERGNLPVPDFQPFPLGRRSDARHQSGIRNTCNIRKQSPGSWVI
jgi:hypothetical protein